jgi:hypothetical protein
MAREFPVRVRSTHSAPSGIPSVSCPKRDIRRQTRRDIQIHRIHLPTLCSSTSGVRLRNFTPRRSDYPTDSVAILSPGFTLALPILVSKPSETRHCRPNDAISCDRMARSIDSLQISSNRNPVNQCQFFRYLPKMERRARRPAAFVMFWPDQTIKSFASICGRLFIESRADATVPASPKSK